MVRIIAALASLTALFAAQEAQACGGFFCDQQAAPVQQAGERILFLQQHDGRLVTYVQIQFSGSSQNFSWVVPVKGTPTIDAGSDALFAALEQSTAPQTQVTQPACPQGAQSAPAAATSSGCAGGSNGKAFADSAAYVPGSSVDVLSRGVAGPYTYAILAASEPQELFDWLTVNSYTLTDSGKQLLKLYVDADHHFLAVKLAPERTVGDLRPVVIRSDEPEPCIPLRLTAVAATPDMPIEAFVVGSKRAVPDNYAHVVLNDARLGFLGGGNYQSVLSEAVDQAPGGEAFVTEYAGSTQVMKSKVWPDAGYPVDSLRTMTDRTTYQQTVFSRGIPFTASFTAWAQKWQTAPTFDPQQATDELVADILKPMQDAQAMLDSGPYLTRLSTTISPQEMMDDPTFTFTSSMGDVSNVHVAVDPASCGAADSGTTLKLSDGRVLHYGTGSSGAPSGWEAGPAALVVQRFDHDGSARVLEDHTKDVPQDVQVGDNAGSGCHSAAAAGGALAWMAAATLGLTLLRRRARR